jgi:hypothetical protein
MTEDVGRQTSKILTSARAARIGLRSPYRVNCILARFPCG